MNALENAINIIANLFGTDLDKHTKNKLNEIDTLLRQSFAPTVEQEEIEDILTILYQGLFRVGADESFWKPKFDKLRQYILQPNKAVEVIKIKIESINVLLECQIYDNKYQKSRLLLLLESYQELLKEIEGEK